MENCDQRQKDIEKGKEEGKHCVNLLSLGALFEVEEETFEGRRRSLNNKKKIVHHVGPPSLR